jgi:flagellar hook-associated protein 2
MLKTRQSIYEEFKVEDGFSGAFKLITDIGISTERYSRGDAGGKLVIDEEKLKNAIANNPEDVMELLFKESVPAVRDDKGKVIKEGKSGGLVTRIYDNLMLGMEDIIKKSGTGNDASLYRGVKGNILLDFVSKYSSISLIDKDVLKYDKKIDDLNVMLFKKENNYYAKFAAMEKAISKMNQQNSWLMQQSN